MSLSILLANAGGTANEPAGGGLWAMILPFALMFLVFYFLMIRPQQKKQKQRNMMLLNLSKGDKVTTIGGLHGTIVELTDDIVVLRVNESTRLTFDRGAVSSVVEQAKAQG